MQRKQPGKPSEPRPQRAAAASGPRRPTAGRVRRAASKAAATSSAPAGAIRLQKIMAEAGVASRRDCEEMIRTGRVLVNGERLTTLPIFADPRQDRIEVDGKLLARAPRAGRSATPGHPLTATAGKVYVALYKPAGVISTTSDPEGRPQVIDLVHLPPSLPRRLYPVGRLDAQSTGLILLTNDGELAHRLTHPRYEVPKRYHVSVRGKLAEKDLERLRQGVYLAHPTRGHGPKVRKAAMIEVHIAGYDRDELRGDRTQLTVTLREGQNREIRRLLARLGFKVRRLTRVAIGPLSLKGLAVGQWRLLTGAEVRQLQRAVATPQGVDAAEETAGQQE